MRRFVSPIRFVVSAALLSVCSIVFGREASAQSALLNLPRVSQHARILQRVGITDITIDYSRPQTKGRKVFGGLEQYGKVWRAGANENTTIAFTDPVTIDGKPLAEGVYGLHMIPGEGSWTVIFSKNATSWGSFSYQQSEDALRITVNPEKIADQKVLSYAIDDPTPTSAVITMRWDTTAISFKVGVDTPKLVEASLREQLRGRVQYEWSPWAEAADYLLTNHLDPNEALQYAEHSISNEDRFENEIVKADALAALGRNDEARTTRDKAVGMGTQPQIHSYGRGLQAQGNNKEALELFDLNIKKDPNSWVAHNELARIAVSKGDFDTAIKEMKLALSVAPEALKSQIEAIIVQLGNHVDINK